MADKTRTKAIWIGIFLLLIPLVVYADTTITTTNGTTQIATLGDVVQDQAWAQEITATQSGTVITGSIYLNKLANTTGDFVVSIEGNNGSNLPDGSVQGTVTLPNAGITNNARNTWTLASSIPITNGTHYWVVMNDSITEANAARGYQLFGDATGGTSAAETASVWTAQTIHINMTFTINDSVVAASPHAYWSVIWWQ